MKWQPTGRLRWLDDGGSLPTLQQQWRCGPDTEWWDVETVDLATLHKRHHDHEGGD